MRSILLWCLVAAPFATAGEWASLGPFGGSAAIVVVDRHEPGGLLAATSNAQIFRSEDGGDSWSPLPFPPQFRATLHALAVDPQHAGVYFAGVSSDTPEYSGILRSSDSGNTWSRIGDPDLRSVWSLAMWQQDSNVMAAGTEDGVFLTRDGGLHWIAAPPNDTGELKPVVSLAFDPWESNVLYAGTPHLAWKSTDGGFAWQPIHRGMIDDSDVFSILVDDRRRSRIFASTCGGIYRSVEGGDGWTKLKEVKGASARVYHLSQDLAHPNVLFAGTALGLIKSEDSGTTWRKLSSLATRWVAFDPRKPHRIYVATDEAGLLRSDDDGESLYEINHGFTNRRLASMAAKETDLYVAALSGGRSFLLHGADSDSQWEETPATFLPQASLQAMPSPAPRAYGGSADTDDLGLHDAVWVADGEFLAASARGLVRSVDAGLNWQPVRGVLEGATVGGLCGHPTHPEILFASSFGEIFQSSDRGRTWRPLITQGEHPNDFAGLLVLPGSPDRLIALSPSRGVFQVVLRSGSL